MPSQRGFWALSQWENLRLELQGPPRGHLPETWAISEESRAEWCRETSRNCKDSCKPPTSTCLELGLLLSSSVLWTSKFPFSSLKILWADVFQLQPKESWLIFFFPPGFLGGLDGKESACNAGYPGLIPGSGRSPREGNGNSLWYSCLENPMDRGAWTVLGVATSQTRLSD